ncbi:hypothetical protein KAJ27_18250, partial [bacterium]|nr:hypothetical protein [bacterium]
LDKKTCFTIKHFVIFIIFMLCTTVWLFSEDIDAEDFEALKEFIFYRTSPETELKGLLWKNEYIRKFGEEVFDNLLVRFMKTPEFIKLSTKSKTLQQDPEAEKMKRETQQLSDDIKHNLTRAIEYHRVGLMNVRNGGSNNVFRENKAFVGLMRNVSSQTDFYNEKYQSCYRRYNKLVALYNMKYLGSLPFKTAHLRK